MSTTVMIFFINYKLTQLINNIVKQKLSKSIFWILIFMHMSFRVDTS